MSQNGLCSLCLTEECTNSERTELDPNKSSKEEIGVLSRLPNEVIGLILGNLKLKDLSIVTLTNKWLRDFVFQYFFRSRKGLKLLLGSQLEVTDAVNNDKQRQRLNTFRRLGLLLKRMTCLLPTKDRLEVLVSVFYRLDGFPKPSSISSDNHLMRLTFQCYGRLIHRFIAGWDDSELKNVYKTIQNTTKIENQVELVVKSQVGARQQMEYYVRTYFRMLYLDPAADGQNKTYNDCLFWIHRIMKRRPIAERSRLMAIFYGPLISTSPTNQTTPYIGWWDLTDTFFIENGLFELGMALYVLYNKSKDDEQRKDVMELMEKMTATPENWLMENVAVLLYHIGNEMTFDYLNNKLKGKYAEVAQKLVYLSIVTFRLEKETKIVYKLIEKLALNGHKLCLYNEMPIAFSEAINEAENAIELEDERDVSEVHDIVDANNNLLKFYMHRPSTDSSQSSIEESQKCNQDSEDHQNEE